MDVQFSLDLYPMIYNIQIIKRGDQFCALTVLCHTEDYQDILCFSI